MKPKILFTSEAVSEGHPDKICDQIADAILDECLAHDQNSRTAVEVLVTNQKVIIAGEVTSSYTPDYKKIARNILNRIGYHDAKNGIDADTCDIEVLVKTQSQDIALGVNSSYDTASLGAGDQGIMFGYASIETENLMPLPIVMAHKLVRVATNYRHEHPSCHLCPDMKSQVTVDYSSDNSRIDTVVFSSQHDENISIEDLRELITKEIIMPVAESFGMNKDFKVFINPTGRFVIGGPAGDTGVTGRKIIVDT
ncbi:MAG TPA: methionine adenosyltransferase, partial [Firmicutes bacterium]|nr:methionine adenosyltransferase [Bacillota bacterium]